MGDWSLVTPAIAEETRTCAYDRLGTGTSSPAEGCRQLDDLLDDLDALLLANEVPRPYVFVGASGGGYLAVGMAERHVDELAGIVLAETPQAIPPEIAAEIEDEIACDAADQRRAAGLRRRRTRRVGRPAPHRRRAGAHHH